jgi:NAD(P)-dependent dehydrogenase (short-subunit alcohol dehydrogenase family)
MKAALIIGASRGIGREYVRQLLEADWKVHATARTDGDIEELRKMGALPIRLDVASTESISGLAWQLDGEKLDLAAYVAGVFGPNPGAKHAPTTEDFDRVMHTNVLGAMQLIPTVAPMVEAARGKFIFITSGMGSIGEAESSSGWVYRASKAALNMVVKTAAFDYPKAVLAVMNPGWVQTDMGGPNATITAEESIAGMLRVIESLSPSDSGSFRSYNGKRFGW